MGDWKVVRLGDFMLFNPTRTLKKNTVAKKVTMDKLVSHSKVIYEYSLSPYNGGSKFINGDTIMARITPCLENGKHAYVSFLDEGEVGFGSTEYIVMRGKENISDNEFVYYLSKTPCFKNTAVKSMVGSSGRQRAQIDVLENLEMKVPPLSCQRRISSLLSSLDDKIGVNRAICRNLEEQAQALFKEWFVDFAPFKGRPFVDTELGRIPAGWKVGTLGELCGFISRGLSPKYDKSSDEIVLGQTCVRNNIVTLNNSRRHVIKTTQSSKKVKQWDVLINSTGIGSLGRVGVVYFDMDNVAFDSHLTVVRSKEEVYRHYIGRNLLSRQREIENMAVGSTGQTELPKKDVLTMKIIVPPADVLLQTNSLFENYANMMYRLIEESSRLSRLRDTMLPRLMSGELAVPCGACEQADAGRR